MKIKRKLIEIFVSILLWIGIWWFAAWKKGISLLFPTPIKVFSKLFELLGTRAFYQSIFTSIGRIVLGILLAMIAGILLSGISHRYSWFRSFLLPAITVIKTTPVASFIILFMLWIGSSSVPTLITFFIVLPVVWTNLDVGLSKIDPELLNLAKVYRFQPIKKTRLLVLPSVFPYFLSAGRSSLGLAWKAGIAAEVLTMPKVGIGTEIGIAKLYINTEEMFAWTLTIIFISLIIEFGFVKLVNVIPVFRENKEEK